MTTTLVTGAAGFIGYSTALALLEQGHVVIGLDNFNSYYDVTLKRARASKLGKSVVIHEGELKTLKRLKDEVKEVREGYECGMAFENYDGIAEGDMIECFEVEAVARQL